MCVEFIVFKAAGKLGWVLIRIFHAVNLVAEAVNLLPLSRCGDRYELEASGRQADYS